MRITDVHLACCVCEGQSAYPSAVSLPHIFLLVVLSDRNALAVGFELMLDNLSICIVFYTERVVQHSRDVIVTKKKKKKE